MCIRDRFNTTWRYLQLYEHQDNTDAVRRIERGQNACTLKLRRAKVNAATARSDEDKRRTFLKEKSAFKDYMEYCTRTYRSHRCVKAGLDRRVNALPLRVHDSLQGNGIAMSAQLSPNHDGDDNNMLNLKFTDAARSKFALLL